MTGFRGNGLKKNVVFMVMVTVAVAWLVHGVPSVHAQVKADHHDSASSPAPAEDISGMYSFLNDGEFVQIDLEKSGATGYISRMGDLESDRGTFLDQFFSKASVQGHDVAFTTKQIHGVWFEFKGRFDRGPAKTKTSDGYYVLRGTLKEFTTDANKNTTSRSREVEFKLLAQPDDSDEPAVKSDRPKD
jgi:hypothetical protein